MNSSDDTPDAELLERYRQASRAEVLAPREVVRTAILEEGRRVAAVLSAPASSQEVRHRLSRPGPSRWKMAAFATAATVLLAAVVIAPRLLERERADGNVGTPKSPFKQAAVRKVQPDAAEYASTPPVHIARIGAPLPPKAENTQPQAQSMPAPVAVQSPGRSAELSAITQRSDAAARSGADALARRESVSDTMLAAAATGDTTKAAKLLDHGRFVDERNEAGRTPLMLAIATGNVEMVRLLLGHGADSNATDGAGVTPLKLAQQKGLSEIASVLTQSGAR